MVSGIAATRRMIDGALRQGQSAQRDRELLGRQRPVGPESHRGDQHLRRRPGSGAGRAHAVRRHEIDGVQGADRVLRRAGETRAPPAVSTRSDRCATSQKSPSASRRKRWLVLSHASSGSNSPRSAARGVARPVGARATNRPISPGPQATARPSSPSSSSPRPGRSRRSEPPPAPGQRSALRADLLAVDVREDHALLRRGEELQHPGGGEAVDRAVPQPRGHAGPDEQPHRVVPLRAAAGSASMRSRSNVQVYDTIVTP